MSPLSAEYRSTIDPEDSVDDGRRGGPGAITVSQALLSAFTASLEAHRVHLRFFAGSWATTSLHDHLFLPLLAPPESSESKHRAKFPPYDIVLASETIYRSETLDAFIGLLRAATTTTTTSNVPGPPPLCLVAAKVLYFGVGGGVEGFVRAVEAEGGVVRTVWEHREGVGRRIMRIEW
jgi:protein-histidine N-methyltransferase